MSKHKRWICYCLKMAHKSSVATYKHAACLVKGGRVISVGINKTKAGILGDQCYDSKGWHSELDCLIAINPEMIRGATLYVAGISKSNNTILSKPCPHCQEFLAKYELKAVYYSTQHDFEKLII